MMRSLLRNIFAVADPPSTSDLLNPRFWLLDAFGKETLSGERVDPDKALALAAYFSCIRNIAEDIGKIPLKIYRRLDGGGKRPAPEHPFWNAMHNSPNPWIKSSSFFQAMIVNKLGWGNAIAEITKNNQGLPEFYPHHPSVVKLDVKSSRNPPVIYKVRRQDGIEVELPQNKLLHVYGVGSTGYSGWSVARFAAECLGEGLALDKFGQTFFKNATVGSGVLEIGEGHKFPNEEKIELMRKQWQDRYGDPNNRHRPIILENNMKYTPISIPPDNAQWIEARQFKVEEIARWFRMPLAKIQHHLRAQGWSTLEQLDTNYVVDCLIPHAVSIEQEINRKLFADDDEFFVEYLFQGLMRGDMKTRAMFYRSQFMIGALSPNDISEMENMNPSDQEGADSRWIQTSMTTLDRAAMGQTGSNNSGFVSDNGSEAMEKMKPIVLDAARRVVAKELRATDRLKRKHAGDKQSFDKAIEEFYGKLSDDIVSALYPVLSVIGENDEKARRIADEYCEGSRGQCDKWFDGLIVRSEPGKVEYLCAIVWKSCGDHVDSSSGDRAGIEMAGSDIANRD